MGPNGDPGPVLYYLVDFNGGKTKITQSDYDSYMRNADYWGEDMISAIKAGVRIYADAGFQKSVDKGNVGGLFGAGPFAAESVLGQMTTSGYVVAANSQVGQPESCGSCAHVIMNLNPSIRAQFTSIIPWDGGSKGTFETSGAPVQANQFGQLFTYVLGNGKSVTLPTLLDTGVLKLGNISDSGVLAQEIAAGHIDPKAQPNAASTGNAQGNVVSGLPLVMTGAAPGATPTTLTTASPFFGDTSSMLTVSPSNGANPTMLSGIQFFFVNSVMYDLQNKLTGYTPFFVSAASISTNGAGYTVTSTMAAQGVAGVISGTGSLIISDKAAAQLSNANTYVGATQISKNGWLGLAGPGSIAASSGVQADGTFDISRASGAEFIQSLSGSGNVTLGGNTLVLTHAGGTFGGALVDGGVGGGSGGSVIVASGRETLTGKNTFSGNLGIGVQGAVDLRGSVAGSVQDAGVLSGNGRIGRNLAVTGVIAPGAGAGTYQTLTIDGTYHQQAGATYIAELEVSGKSSQIVVKDIAVLDPGAHLSILAPTSSQGATYIKGTKYTLLSSGQKLTGTYTVATAMPVSAVLGLVPTYDLKHAYMDVVQSRALTTAAQTPNQRATLAGVDSLPPANKLFSSLANLPADPFIRSAANMLSGEVYPSTSAVFLNDSHVIRDAVTARLESAARSDGTSNVEGTPTTQRHANGLTSWGQFVGRWGRYDGNGEVSRLTDTLSGFLVGADLPLGEHARLGVAGGHTHTSFQSAYSLKNASNDTSVSLYGGAAWDAFRLDGGVAYTTHSLSVNRNAALLSGAETLTSRHDASTRQAFGEAGYAIKFKASSVEPFVQAAYVQLRNAAFNEHGAVAALQVAGQRDAVTYTTLGTHLSTQFPFDREMLTAYGTLGWRHASGAINPTSLMHFAGGSDFSIAGVPLARNAWVVDAGLAFQVRPSLSFHLTYNGQLATHVLDSGFKAGVTWRF